MTDWFEWFDNLKTVDKAEINWPVTLDFKVQGTYIVEDILDITKKIKDSTETELLQISQHCQNLLGWVNQMEIMGFLSLKKHLDELLERECDDKNIIYKLREDSFNMWISGKEGQYKIGENYYNIHQGKVYYRNLLGLWFLVDKNDVFDLNPKQSPELDSTLTNTLDKEYNLTVFDKIYLEWKKTESKNFDTESLFEVQTGDTTPDEVFKRSEEKIKKIINNPVTYQEIEKLVSEGTDYIEHMIKISYVMADFVETRRSSGEHSVYLLRDCLIFYEIQKTIDLIEKRETSFDQLLIGRKVLSNKKREGGHWFLTQEILFYAYQKSPHNFSEFYNEYSRLIKEYTEYSKEFADLLANLAVYIKKHIKRAQEDNRKIAIVDLGFQGSINIFVKYIIDNYCSGEVQVETDIQMFVLAEWFKTVYPNKHASETYTLLTTIEDLARNEYLYDYKKDSFQDGELLVVMGSEEDQRKATIELIIVTMVTVLSKKLHLL